MAYALCVLIGLLAGWTVRRWQRPDPPALAAVRTPLLLAAAVGAVLGAHLGELPADLLGWTWAPDRGTEVLVGGRTVVGGLLGGWIAVEIIKWRLGVRQATGDGFAAPLAAALACGRVGCLFAGCCAGVACDGAWWAMRDAASVPRFPAPLLEAVFHAVAAVLLLIAQRRGAWPGRLLAVYLVAYAALRFILETWRPNPPVALGLSWYQWLCLPLAALAGAAWWRRRRAPPLLPSA